MTDPLPSRIAPQPPTEHVVHEWPASEGGSWTTGRIAQELATPGIPDDAELRLAMRGEGNHQVVSWRTPSCEVCSAVAVYRVQARSNRADEFTLTCAGHLLRVTQVALQVEANRMRPGDGRPDALVTVTARVAWGEDRPVDGAD